MRKNPRWLFATVAASGAALAACATAQDIDPRSGLPNQAGFAAGNGGGTMPFAPQGAYGAQAATPGEVAGPGPADTPYGDGYQYPKFFPRVNVGHFMGQGVGFRNNYTTASVWVPLQLGDPNDLAFADVHGIVDNRSRLGANIGMGWRRLNAAGTRIFGVYGYYDYRDTGAARYSQISGGFEVLGKVFDWRSNVYLPFHDGVIITSDAYDCNNPRADGNFLFLTHLVGKQVAYRGGDTELGFPFLAKLIPGGKAHLGGYAFTATDSRSAMGFRARLEAQLNSWTRVEGVWQNDRVFGNTAFGGVTLTWPGFKRNVVDDQESMVARLAQPVYRQQNIAIFDSVQSSQEAAADPVTRQPIRIIYVNGAAAPGGNGTLGTPFNSLVAAQAGTAPGDLIFVQAGTFTSGIVLQAGQRLIGNGGSPIPGKSNGALTFAVAQCPGVGIVLPNVTSDPTARPILQGVVGNAITLANNNEVGSLQILNTQGSGIVGTGVQGFILHDLTVSGSTGPGIVLTNAFGIGSITRSIVSGNAAGGVVVVNNNGNALALNLVCNEINNNNGSFLTGNGLAVTALGSNVAVTSDLNQYNGNTGAGASFTTGTAAGPGGTAGQLTVASSNDQFNQNQNHGAQILAPTGTVTASFTNDQFILNSRPTPPPAGNTVPSAGVFANLGGAGAATADITVANSTLASNEGSGFDLRMDNAGSSATVALTGNTIGQNKGNGVFIRALNGTTTTTISGNAITGNAQNGIAFQGFGTSTGTMAIANNTIVSNGIGPASLVDPLTGQAELNGIYLALFSNVANAYTATISGNTISNNGFGGTGDGIQVEMSTQAPAGVNPSAAVTIANNVIQNNQQDGIRFFEGGGTVAYQLAAAVRGNTITNNGSNGVEYTLRQFGLLTLLVDNNTISANRDSGVRGLNQSQGIGESAGVAVRIQQNVIDGNGALGGLDGLGLPLTGGINLGIFSEPTAAFAGIGQPVGINLVNINNNTRISNNQVGIIIQGAGRSAVSITNHRNATDDQARIIGNRLGGIVLWQAYTAPPGRTPDRTHVMDVNIDRNVIDATPNGGGPNSGTEAIVLGVSGGTNAIPLAGARMEALVTRNILRGAGYTPALSPVFVPVGTLPAFDRSQAISNARFLAVSGAFGIGDNSWMRLRLEQANVNDLQYNTVLLPPTRGPNTPPFNMFDIASTASTNFGKVNPALVNFFAPPSAVYGFAGGGTGADFENAQPNPANITGNIAVVQPLNITPGPFPPLP